MTLRLSPNGGPIILAPLPISGTRHERQKAVVGALRGALMPAPPEPTAPIEAPSETDSATLSRFRAELAAIELERGDDAMSAEIRAALEADPVLRAEWLRKFDSAAAERKKNAERSAEAQKVEDEAVAAKARARILNTALPLAFNAGERR